VTTCPCGCGQPRSLTAEYATAGPSTDDARRRTRPTSVSASSEWDGRLTEGTTPGNDSRRLRGIPAIGRSVAGVINGTQPGAGYCGDCGKRSGEHHHRTCTLNGVIV
jgi:hypothetical protein